MIKRVCWQFGLILLGLQNHCQKLLFLCYILCYLLKHNSLHDLYHKRHTGEIPLRVDQMLMAFISQAIYSFIATCIYPWWRQSAWRVHVCPKNYLYHLRRICMTFYRFISWDKYGKIRNRNEIRAFNHIRVIFISFVVLHTEIAYCDQMHEYTIFLAFCTETWILKNRHSVETWADTILLSVYPIKLVVVTIVVVVAVVVFRLRWILYFWLLRLQ